MKSKMKLERYLELRKSFYEQYNLAKKSDLGFVSFTAFKIYDFKQFMFLFSIDNLHCEFSNPVIGSKTKTVRIRRNCTAKRIKVLNQSHSMFEKYEGLFQQALTIYKAYNHRERKNKIKNEKGSQ